MDPKHKTPPETASPPDFEMVLASMLGGILVLSDDERIVYANSTAEALLGRSARDIEGRTGTEVFAGSPWLGDLLRRMASTSELALRAEGSIGDGDDATEVLAVVSALHDRAGARTGNVVALHDLGRRVWLRGDEAAHARLGELDNLVSSIAHELNNPLSGIRGAAQLLSRKLSDEPELADYGEMIVRQVDRMGELIRGLMALEAPMPAKEPVNIHRVLNEVILLEKNDAAAQGVTLSTAFDPSLPEVLGNSDQLHQLFLNLVKNAIAVCREEGGSVKVATRMETSFYVETGSRRLRYISVDITDTGPGLDEETKQHMFTPFFSRSHGGHGMGLTIARNIATAHKGHIRAENVEGAGARLRVSLPVAEGGLENGDA